MLTVITIVTTNKASTKYTGEKNEVIEVYFKKINQTKKGRLAELRNIKNTTYIENKQQNNRRKSFTISNHFKCKRICNCVTHPYNGILFGNKKL